MTQLSPVLSPGGTGFGPSLDLRTLVQAATVSLVVLVGGLGGAAMLVPIDGAVVAQGQLLVQGKAQPIQSLDPGIVAKVAVQNGQKVAAGALLIGLDQTTARARLDIAMEQLAAALAQEARLAAEATGMAEPDFTPPPLPFAAPDMTGAIARQAALFAARKDQIRAAHAQLADSEAQIAAQSDGLVAQMASIDDELALLRTDSARQTALVEKGLSRQAALSDLQRAEAAATGRMANLAAEKIRLIGASSEARARLSQDDSRRAEEVAQSLRDAAAESQALRVEIVTLIEALARTELRAPVAGVVYELAVSTPGAVVAAGSTLLEIVPSERALEVEVSVDPRHIDRLHTGQTASVMIASFDPRAVPRVPAHVVNIPPGAVTDPNTGRSFYRVTLELDPTTLPDGLELLPGMPVEAFVATGERPLMSWLIAPLVEPMARAMREE